MDKPLIFVANPGSASRKYALFEGENCIAGIHFEFVNNRIVGTLSFNDQKRVIKYDDENLSTVSKHIVPMLKEFNVIGPDQQISAIGIRIVAPSRRFMQDAKITTELENALDNLREEAPLHIRTALNEVKQLKTYFPNIPIIGVSDSAFHKTKPDKARYYGIDIKLAEKHGIERYGYHGISLGSIVRCLKQNDVLMQKVIVCHLGSGSSVTAIEDGKSVDNTMGYSPLEGLMMATRSGTMDISAALVIKSELKLTDIGLEEYLDKQAGLLGVSGSSDDIRLLLMSETRGDKRAKLALDIYVYKVQQAIGQMAAAIGGVNCLVFTGTVGERSGIIRERIVENLGYLGFEVSKKLNDETFEPTEITNVASKTGKPILVISTDEAFEIARRTSEFVK